MKELEEIDRPSKWFKFLYYLWKIFTCVFLHLLLIAIVVGYCFFGAYMFKTLEEQYEKDMKKNITDVRNNITAEIWKYSNETLVHIQQNWTEAVKLRLRTFEAKLIWAMRKGGWNGNETETSLQWTHSGALFYSIIVITTIGYGHIAPKTPQGKIATIFYAVVGIPLMLLCLSNIGDVMAQSFRFIYWRICCYKCTQMPRRMPTPIRRARSLRSSGRSHGNRISGRSRTTSFRQSGRNSQKSADSAVALSESYVRSSYSDTECRYNDEIEHDSVLLEEDKLFNRQSQQSRYSDNVTMYQVPRQSQHSSCRSRMALDPHMAEYEYLYSRNSPVVFNKYALEREESCRIQPKTKEYRAGQCRDLPSKNDMVTSSKYMLASSGIASLSRTTSSDYSNRYRREKPYNRLKEKESIGPSPRIMSPLGFAVHRQTFSRVPRENYYDDFFDYDYDYYDYQQDYTRPVPIWLCVFLVVSYIIGGACLFTKQEPDWGFFNAAYFCFITLTTIGFGDYVPEPKEGEDQKLSAAICSVYLLFGIALLAMSFNLVQEEVINNVKSVARHLGIIKDEEIED